MKRIVVCLLLSLLIGPRLQAQNAAKPELRTWKDATGQFSIEAVFVRVTGDQVVLQRTDKKELSIPLAKLSPADRQYVKTRLTPKPSGKKYISPALTAKVTWATGIIKSGRLPKKQITENSVYLDVPYRKQERLLCVPTCASMTLSYFKDPHVPRELKVLSRKQKYIPQKPFKDYTITLYKDLRVAMEQIGYSWKYINYKNTDEGFVAGITAIKENLQNKNPVLVDVAFESSHTFLIIGYDEAKELVYIRDSNIAKPGLRILSYQQLKSIWNGKGYGLDARPTLFTSRKPRK